jgi:hypothetical protein
MGDHIMNGEADELAVKPFDASDPESVNRARKKAGRKKVNRLRIIEAVMEQPEGRKWMYEVLNMCHIYSTPFVQGDPYASAFQMGEQNIGNMLLADVQAAAPANYLLMCKEGNTDDGM